MEKLILRSRSVIPALDVLDYMELVPILQATMDEGKIGAYKVGFTLGLTYGLESVVKQIKHATGKLVIYDHQKAATDIPDTGKQFAEVMVRAGVDSVILFPQAGPITEMDWIKYCQDAGLHVIVGGKMTHKAYTEEDGGFLRKGAPEKMYEIAVKEGVNDLVVPGNQSEFVSYMRERYPNVTFYAPGFIDQGGSISKTGEAAGNNWHAIVGRGISGAEDKKEAVKELVKDI